MKTEQEKFWKGKFGFSYSKRERNLKDIKSRVHHFKKILKNTKKIKSIFEIGTNIGLNLDAIKKIKPAIKTNGVEINKEVISKINKKHVIFNGSILNFESKNNYDLVFTRAVLIHINPKKLSQVYKKIYDLSKKYILIDEFFNPTPISIDYRGHKNKLFKRDFAYEIMKKYNLKLVDYGFGWSKDPKFPQVDSNWFLFQKKH